MRERHLNLDLSRDHAFENDIFDFMGSMETISLGNERFEIEVDYAWDFNSDPLITPTIIYEWLYLDKLVSKHVLRDAQSVLSIGGGGTCRTHEYLSPITEEFVILNTGIWDLETAQSPSNKIRTIKIRAMAESIPILDNAISAIEIPATLDHVVDAKKVIEESFRILSNGGRIGITLGNSKSWYREVFIRLRISTADNHEHHHNFHFTNKDVEKLLSDAGFIEIKTKGSAYLKLPKFVERQIKFPILLSVHRFISNKVLKSFFGNSRGGMFLTYAVKPSKK